MAAHQAPPSPGFPRQEHWSGLPFPSPMHESEKWKWSRSVESDPQQPHGLQPFRLLHPWDFPGKSTGVGCHCLLCPLFPTTSNHLWLFKHHLNFSIGIVSLEIFSALPQGRLIALLSCLIFLHSPSPLGMFLVLLARLFFFFFASSVSLFLKLLCFFHTYHSVSCRGDTINVLTMKP